MNNAAILYIEESKVNNAATLYIAHNTWPTGESTISSQLRWKKSVPGRVCNAPSPALNVSSPEMKHWLAETILFIILIFIKKFVNNICYHVRRCYCDYYIKCLKCRKRMLCTQNLDEMCTVSHKQSHL